MTMKWHSSLFYSLFLFLLFGGSVLLQVLEIWDFKQLLTPDLGMLLSNRLPVEGNKMSNEWTFAGDTTISGPAAGKEDSERQHRWKMEQTQEQRHRLLAKACATQKLGNKTEEQILPSRLSNVYVEERSRLLYCSVPKVGCSNWKRVLMVLAGNAASAPDITHQTAHQANKLRRLSTYNRTEIEHRLNTYTKVVFTREPLQRLVAAFRDKFQNPEKYFHGFFGRAIIRKYRPNAKSNDLRTGDGVTFKEFVQYLLDERRPVGMDIHWLPVNELCSPCLLHYNLLGKMETVKEDADFVLRSIMAPGNVTYPDFKDRNPQDERTSMNITQQYFAQLSPNQRQKVYDFYRMDYLMFNYPKPFPDLQ